MTIASLVVASLCFAAAGVAGNGSTLPTWTFVVVGVLVLAVLWTWSIRRNQRRALRNADELTRLLSLVLAEGPPTM
jgi:membrane protein implicated in regulation of membrane protease activity